MKILIPDDVNFILNRLNEYGYEAFVVGGCVRDSLLGLTPHDWDICTNALPHQIQACFSEFYQFDAGVKHGTVSVVYNKEVYEITTYRIDGDYSDNRHPQNVTFTKDIFNDLARRDFTVNAMAYNDKSGLVDFYGGQADLENRIIRCVGNADERFNEDALRIIRALRFASHYEFSIESKTSESIFRNSCLLNNIAAERISVELLKLLCGNGAEEILNNYRDVIAVIIPELEAEFDFNQHNKHHNRDLWHHTTHSVASIESNPALRMTMLLHDISKPECCSTDSDGVCHFYRHPVVGAEKAHEILRRLKFSNEFIKECETLIKYHDVRYSGSKRQLRRMLNKIGEKNMLNLIKVQRADVMAQSDYKRAEKLELISKSEVDLNEIINSKSCFNLNQLAVNGRDLIEIGITDGKQIGSTLKTLLNKVIDEKLENNKEDLLACAKMIAEGKTDD